MARLRTIKPGFFTNDALAECQPLARLLFAGLWCHADREGRLEDRAKRLKVEILPYDDCDVDALLGELHEHGLIVRYAVNGKSYIAVPTWSKHQNPHVKEASSTIPAPPEPGEHSAFLPINSDKHQTSTVQAPDKHSSFRAGVGRGEWGGELSLESRHSPPATPTVSVAPDASAPDAPPASTGAGMVLVGPHGRPLDVLWEALTDVFGEPMLDDERNALNGVCKKFRDAAARKDRPEEEVAQQIKQAAGNWANVMADATMTPHALARHFTTLLSGPQVNGRHSGTVTKHQQTLTEAALISRRETTADVLARRRLQQQQEIPHAS